MFERFTEKAIKVIMLAQEEARRLGHNFVGTEQILLGLIGEGTGIGPKVLKSMGVNLKDARVEVEKKVREEDDVEGEVQQLHAVHGPQVRADEAELVGRHEQAREEDDGRDDVPANPKGAQRVDDAHVAVEPREERDLGRRARRLVVGRDDLEHRVGAGALLRRRHLARRAPLREAQHVPRAHLALVAPEHVDAPLLGRGGLHGGPRAAP